MQRYFFNLADEAYPLDLQGIEFPDLAGAAAEAVRFAAEVANARPELVTTDGKFRIEVTDPTRTMVFTLMTTAAALPL